VSGAWSIAETVLRVALAGFFLFLSWRAVSGDAQTAADFARWGYPAAFRIFTGACQAIGAIALLFPQTALIGAAVLAPVLLGAIATHLMHDPWATSLSPLLFLVLVGVAVIGRLPGWQG
jgi:uncharacterized membrane protein YphA (DoxX/SURF4 family)